jgi:hypothetical protein
MALISRDNYAWLFGLFLSYAVIHALSPYAVIHAAMSWATHFRCYLLTSNHEDKGLAQACPTCMNVLFLFCLSASWDLPARPFKVNLKPGHVSVAGLKSLALQALGKCSVLSSHQQESILFLGVVRLWVLGCFLAWPWSPGASASTGDSHFGCLNFPFPFSNFSVTSVKKKRKGWSYPRMLEPCHKTSSGAFSSLLFDPSPKEVFLP